VAFRVVSVSALVEAIAIEVAVVDKEVRRIVAVDLELHIVVVVAAAEVVAMVDIRNSGILVGVEVLAASCIRDTQGTAVIVVAVAQIVVEILMMTLLVLFHIDTAVVVEQVHMKQVGDTLRNWHKQGHWSWVMADCRQVRPHNSWYWEIDKLVVVVERVELATSPPPTDQTLSPTKSTSHATP
jgi:hypothetical protein